MQPIELNDERDTARLAAALAKQLQPVDCITLTGTLGAGKTTFVRYLLQNLGVDGAVISPTFMLMQEYDVTLPSGETAVFYHIDGYRIENELEIPELGIEEIAENSILCIEWPEKFLRFLPEARMDVTLNHIDGNGREVTVSSPENAKQRGESLAATYDS